MDTKASHNVPISPEQERAIALMISGINMTKTAEELGISRRTIHRWFKDPRFAEEYEQRRNELREAGLNELIGLIGDSVSALRVAIQNGDDKAALALLDRLRVFEPDPRSNETQEQSTIDTSALSPEEAEQYAILKAKARRGGV